MPQPGKAEQINTEKSSKSLAGVVFQSRILWEETEKLRLECQKAGMGSQHLGRDPIPGVTVAWQAQVPTQSPVPVSPRGWGPAGAAAHEGLDAFPWARPTRWVCGRFPLPHLRARSSQVESAAETQPVLGGWKESPWADDLCLHPGRAIAAAHPTVSGQGARAAQHLAPTALPGAASPLQHPIALQHPCRQPRARTLSPSHKGHAWRRLPSPCFLP